MMPKQLNKKHFLKAAAQIDREDVPAARQSVYYEVVVNGKGYPPKYLVALAKRFAFGTESKPRDFNAVEAKQYFLKRGYVVIDRRAESEKAIVSEDDESSFPEGTECYRLHRHLERDCKITRKAKAKRLADTGKLECDVCRFNFVQRYGDLGIGFIEAHHAKPVSKLDGTEKTKIADLALVCSNCHRMLHRGEDLLSVRQLKKVVGKQANT